MIKVVLLKEDKAIIVNPVNAGKYLCKNPETIRRWARTGMKIFCNGYEVITKVEEIKISIPKFN